MILVSEIMCIIGRKREGVPNTEHGRRLECRLHLGLGLSLWHSGHLHSESQEKFQGNLGNGYGIMSI